ncbi:MAG: TIGR02646 family protein [Magnetococcus sp. YQC-5]
MKRIEKGVEPSGLATFRSQNPQATWNDFRNEAREAYDELVDEMCERQHGLCAYCEIDLLKWHQNRLVCSVDHFHPKSDLQDGKNWGLEYDNLFLCCRGGSAKHDEASGHYLDPRKENLSCDAKKADRVLDGSVLTPFMVPRSPMIFKIIKSGAIEHNPDNCHAVGMDVLLVQKTIDEFGLNCNRLKRAREMIWKSLAAQVNTMPEMLDYSPLIQKYLTPDQNNRLTPFFSTIRAFFGKQSEAFLSKEA